MSSCGGTLLLLVRSRRDEFQLRKPGKRLFLPGIPHRPLVAVEAMAAGRQLQVLRRYLLALQGLEERLAVLWYYSLVIFGVGQESRRSFRGHLLLVGEQLHQLGGGVLAQKVVPGPP